MTNDITIGGWCLAAYLYNTSGDQFAIDMHGEASHPNYLEEKATEFTKVPSRALGKLDDDHFKRLMVIAFERHGAMAQQRFLSPMDRLRTFMDKST